MNCLMTQEIPRRHPRFNPALPHRNGLRTRAAVKREDALVGSVVSNRKHGEKLLV